MTTTLLVAKNRAFSKLAAALTIGATSIDVTAYVSKIGKI